MKICLLPAAIAAGLLSGMVSAQAADVIEEPAPVAYEQPISTSGWYLRGDVGYVFKNDTSGDYSFYNQFPGAQGIDDVFDYDIDLNDAVSFGGGVGYRFTDQLRGDVTLDYFKTDVNGSASCISYITAAAGLDFYNDCEDKGEADASIWTALANAYIDIGKFGPVTPYIGAGLGVARVKYSDLRNEQVCGSDPACDGIENYVGENSGETSYRFAAALAAGATFDLTQALKLDAGYRYTHIDGGDAFGYDKADKSFGASGVQYNDDGFDIHTIRAGLRYEFGGSGFASSEPEAAPVYK